MKTSDLKRFLKRVFLRDLNISKKGFLYFLSGFLFLFIALDYILMTRLFNSTIDFLAINGIFMLVMIFITIVASGFIVDRYKNRMQLLVLTSIGVVGAFLIFHFLPFEISFLAVGLIIFFGGIFLIDLLTIITHETTILNRGRIYAYLFFISYIVSRVIVVISLMLDNIMVIIGIEAFLSIFIFFVSTQYSYIETEKRLTSDLSFGEIIIEREELPILGYLLAYMGLGFIIGNAFQFNIKFELDPLSFLIIALFFFLIAGVLLDNQGRKWTFTAGILIISSLVIFSGVFAELYNSIFFGVTISIVLIMLFVFTSDFATERDTLKYRGRIPCLFLFFLFGGFFIGVLVKFILNEVYLMNPTLLSWFPALINGINSFLLVLLLVWIMPLPEILSAKESDWAQSLRNLYVFNKNSICLYTKNFLSNDYDLELPSEDLVTGGLTGILALISEITNEKKNLRIIDKDKVKIYFAYGENVIVSLISTKYLPILFKKLEIFTKAFEDKFEEELLNFTGKINVFKDETDSLVSKYFK
ncbi:MAG: MFS transporter [Promethearchaeia archaeon]